MTEYNLDKRTVAALLSFVSNDDGHADYWRAVHVGLVPDFWDGNVKLCIWGGDMHTFAFRVLGDDVQDFPGAFSFAREQFDFVTGKGGFTAKDHLTLHVDPQQGPHVTSTRQHRFAPAADGRYLPPADVGQVLAQAGASRIAREGNGKGSPASVELCPVYLNRLYKVGAALSGRTSDPASFPSVHVTCGKVNEPVPWLVEADDGQRWFGLIMPRCVPDVE